MFKFLLAGMAGILLAAGLLTTAGAAGEGRVRVIHASPDAPNVDVYANGNRVLSNVPFKASSGYLSVPAGTYVFRVYPAGANPSTASAVLSIDATVQAGVDYTVVALDRVSQIKGRVFVDDNTAPASGKAHINVIHAGPDAPAVDVAVKGGPVLVSGAGFGAKAGPLPVDAGAYDLEVRPAGSNQVALAVPGVSLESGKLYTFVATGFLNGQPALTVVPFVESPVAAAPATGSAHVAPPRAGDGGLAATDSAGTSYLLYGAIALTVVAFAGAARAVTRN
jgi:hypothetical protein